MATQTGGATVGTKYSHGERRSLPAPVGVTADVTITFDDTKIKTQGDLLAACKAIALQLLPQ